MVCDLANCTLQSSLTHMAIAGFVAFFIRSICFVLSLDVLTFSVIFIFCSALIWVPFRERNALSSKVSTFRCTCISCNFSLFFCVSRGSDDATSYYYFFYFIFISIVCVCLFFSSLFCFVLFDCFEISLPFFCPVQILHFWAFFIFVSLVVVVASVDNVVCLVVVLF